MSRYQSELISDYTLYGTIHPNPRSRSSQRRSSNKAKRRRTNSVEEGDRGKNDARRKSYASKTRRERPKFKKNDPSMNEGIVSKSDWIMPIEDRTDLKKRYKFEGKIGDGNFATVFRAKALRNKRSVAIKQIDRVKVKGKEQYIQNEVEVMARCRHAHIVNMIAAYKTKSHFFVVLELLQHGDLFEAIKKDKHFDEETVAGVMKDTASALSYIHSFHIAHRDIKPENLLLTSDFRIKLADFGLACRVKGPLYRVCGTPSYVAPEVLEERGYGEAADVWSFGIISYIMVCGYAPFRNTDRKKLFKLIQEESPDYSDPRWNKVSSDCMSLIKKMLQKQPKKRVTAQEISKNGWVLDMT